MDLANPVDVESVDVHTLACTLKLFFRDLPQPLIPAESYTAFTTLAGMAAGHESTCAKHVDTDATTNTNMRHIAENSFTKDTSTFDHKRPPAWIAEMKALIASLPDRNRLLLSFLVQLLADVVAHKYVVAISS
jgi:hypothetical protein